FDDQSFLKRAGHYPPARRRGGWRAQRAGWGDFRRRGARIVPPPRPPSLRSGRSTLPANGREGRTDAQSRIFTPTLSPIRSRMYPTSATVIGRSRVYPTSGAGRGGSASAVRQRPASAPAGPRAPAGRG